MKKKLSAFALFFALCVLATGRNVTIVNPKNKPVPIKVAGTVVASPTPTASPVATATATATATPTATASAFDPTTIAGLKAWYKADAITTPGFIIRRPDQRPGGIAEPKDEIEPRVINDGDPVNTWPDSSGSGNSISTAGSGMSSPTFRATAGPNAKPCVQFDGVNNGLYVPGAAGFTAIPQPDTVIVVYDTGNPLTYNLSSQILNPDNIHVGMYAATSVNSTRTLVANQFIIHSTVFNDPSSSIYINGTLLVGPTSCGAQPITGISINNYGPALGPSAGKVCELLIYNSALSTTDRQNVENYLKGKYAIP